MYLVSARYTRHSRRLVAAAAACQPNVCHALGFPFVAAAAETAAADYHKCICNKLLTLASLPTTLRRCWQRVFCAANELGFKARRDFAVCSRSRSRRQIQRYTRYLRTLLRDTFASRASKQFRDSCVSVCACVCVNIELLQ